MRKVIQAFCLFLCTALVTVQTAQAANPAAASIFNTIGGTTTIDRGGALHSQARSIYSLGGGMTSFQGKKVSLLAADPPSFSAGCNGISWHFGGFAFISLDEIRQLVEAVAQASLGIAVDLAMQTLCPQCYAVMAKLRDISNMMRNAAADSCKIAQNFGAMLKDSGMFPSTSRTSDCSKLQAESGKTSSWMDAAAGQACSLLSKAETTLTDAGTAMDDFLKFGASGVKGGATPSTEKLEMTGNTTYKALSALGYEDGLMKDMMLSLLGMTVINPIPASDCSITFADLYASAKSTADLTSTTPEEKAALAGLISNGSVEQVSSTNATAEVKPSDKNVVGATPGASGSAKGQTVCYAPPILSGMMQTVGLAIMCGYDREAESANYAANYFKDSGGLPALKKTSLGAMCLTLENKDSRYPLIYTCDKQNSAECTKPQMVRLNQKLTTPPKNGYTGLAWMIGDSLQRGVRNVRDNKKLDSDTIAILNGSGWPLYRLINMAAVYPALAGELLDAYTAAIAAQYTMDTLDKVARIGSQPAINLRSISGLRPQDVSAVREQIMNLVRMGNDSKTEVLNRLAEKRQMVEVIMQVNKTLQAEVIGQGLGGNTSLAVSIKRQAAAKK